MEIPIFDLSYFSVADILKMTQIREKEEPQNFLLAFYFTEHGASKKYRFIKLVEGCAPGSPRSTQLIGLIQPPFGNLLIPGRFSKITITSTFRNQYLCHFLYFKGFQSIYNSTV